MVLVSDSAVTGGMLWQQNAGQVRLVTTKTLQTTDPVAVNADTKMVAVVAVQAGLHIIQVHLQLGLEIAASSTLSWWLGVNGAAIDSSTPFGAGGTTKHQLSVEDTDTELTIKDSLYANTSGDNAEVAVWCSLVGDGTFVGLNTIASAIRLGVVQ